MTKEEWHALLMEAVDNLFKAPKVKMIVQDLSGEYGLTPQEELFFELEEMMRVKKCRPKRSKEKFPTKRPVNIAKTIIKSTIHMLDDGWKMNVERMRSGGIRIWYEKMPEMRMTVEVSKNSDVIQIIGQKMEHYQYPQGGTVRMKHLGTLIADTADRLKKPWKILSAEDRNHAHSNGHKCMVMFHDELIPANCEDE